MQQSGRIVSKVGALWALRSLFVAGLRCCGYSIPQVRRGNNTEQYLLRWTCVPLLVQRTVFSVIRGSYANSTFNSDRDGMDMSILFDDRHPTHISVVSGEDTRPRRPLWPALVIAFAICATLLWASTLLWLLSQMMLFLLAW